MKRKQRIVELEYLRAFSFLAVVLQHAIGHYAYKPDTLLADGVWLGIFLLLTKFAVPVFIFITGVALFYNYEAPVAYFAFLRKRFMDIVLPYLLWAVFYVSIENGYLAAPWHDVNNMGEKIFTGTAYYHLWYIVMIVQLYLIFPILHSALSRLNSRLRLWPRVLFLLVVLTVLYVWLSGKQSEIGFWFAERSIPMLTGYFGEYGDRNGMYFIYYFILGAFVGLHLDTFTVWLGHIRGYMIVMYGFLFVWLGYRIIAHFQYSPELQIHYNDTFLVQPTMIPFLVVSVLFMYILAVSFHHHASERWKKVMSFIGSYSYVGYLAHALMLLAATRLANRILAFGNPTFRTVLAFLICSVLSVLAAVILRHGYRLVRLAISGRAPGAEVKSASISS